VNVRRALGIVALAVMTTSCALTGPSDDSTVTQEGIVYGSYVSNPNAGPVTYVDPVAGAVVSTSLDSATATTDASGHFKLVTKTGPAKDYGCKPYTLTITAPGRPTYTMTGSWGSAGKDTIFCLSAGWPDTVRGSGC
jgi:hypothetical protein